MSAHQDAIAQLATTVATQAELISQLTARVKQLEKQMDSVPREGAVQQLVGDSVDFMLCKRPRPSGSDAAAATTSLQPTACSTYLSPA
jgi:hypothetical protein